MLSCGLGSIHSLTYYAWTKSDHHHERIRMWPRKQTYPCFLYQACSFKKCDEYDRWCSTIIRTMLSGTMNYGKNDAILPPRLTLKITPTPGRFSMPIFSSKIGEVANKRAMRWVSLLLIQTQREQLSEVTTHTLLFQSSPVCLGEIASLSDSNGPMGRGRCVTLFRVLYGRAPRLLYRRISSVKFVSMDQGLGAGGGWCLACCVFVCTPSCFGGNRLFATRRCFGGEICLLPRFVPHGVSSFVSSVSSVQYQVPPGTR